LVDSEISKYIKSIKNDSYFKKLALIYDISDETAIYYYIVDNFDEFREFYDEFKKFQERPEEFSIENYMENGSINLRRLPHIKSQRGADGGFVEGWIILPNFKTYLVKKNPRNYGVWGKWFARRYNILITPKIAEKMGIKCAEYYWCKKTSKSRTEGNITRNFLEDGQTLISGYEINELTNGGITKNKLTDRLKSLEKYLKVQKVDPETIERIRQDYIKLSFFNNFISNSDQRDWNYGLVQDSNGKIIGLAPAFDLDFSCKVYMSMGCELLLDNRNSNISSFINQFKHEQWFIEFIQEFIQNFNMEQILEEVQEEHGITMEPKVLEYYKSFFEKQLTQVKTAIDKCFDTEEPMQRE